MEDYLDLTNQLKYQGGSSIWNNALYNANGNKFHGGTGISLSRETTAYLVDIAILVEGRVQYIVLNIKGLCIGILNIYTPRTTGARTNLWNLLVQQKFLWLNGLFRETST